MEPFLFCNVLAAWNLSTYKSTRERIEIVSKETMVLRRLEIEKQELGLLTDEFNLLHCSSCLI